MAKDRIEYIKRRISHAEKKVSYFKKKHGDNPGQTHTYHGGWDLGYWEGMLAAYYNMLEIEEGQLVSKGI